MIDLQNLCIKFFLRKNELPVSASLFHPIFNRWICEQGASPSAEGQELFIDVADYSHLHHGPVMVLVGHHANYSLDNSGGRMGFLYSRKSFVEGNAEEKILDAFLEALRGCKKLEEDPQLGGALKFKGEEAELFVNNRLLAPNQEETFQTLCNSLKPVLKILYNDSKVSLAPEKDLRKRLTVKIVSAEPVEISTLLERLQKNSILLAK